MTQSKLIAALIEARKAFTTVTKAHTATVPMKSGGKYSYTYASLSDIMEMLDKPLSENGLIVVHTGDTNTLTTTLHHVSGESISSTLPIKGTSPQLLGSEITYMRRYGVSMLLDIATEDDDDGQRGGASAAQSARAQAAAAPQRAATVNASDPKGTALKAMWAQARATGNALGLDQEEANNLVREKLADYNTESTKDLSLEQLKQLRQTLVEIAKENTP